MEKVDQGIKIFGLYDYEKESLAKYSFNEPDTYSIDKENRTTSMEAFSKGDKKIAEFLYSKLQFIDFDTFTKSLLRAADNIKHIIPDSVVFLEPYKSQHWVAKLVAKSTHIYSKCYIKIGEANAGSLENSLKDLPEGFDKTLFNNIIIMDDGSFSGNQMSGNITGARRIISENYNINPIFHIVVPYITKFALDKMQDLKVNVCNAHIMKSVHDVIGGNTSDNVKEFLWPKNTNTRDLKSMALTYFAHKIPNSMSFPEVIAEMLPPIKEPYKQC